MKNRNPYLSLLVLWIIAICVSLTSCIFGVVKGELWQAFFNLALVVFDGVWLGWCICKFVTFMEFIKVKSQLEDGLKQFEKLMKEKGNEPFKEFEENGK